MFTYRWRKMEVLGLERRQLDLKAGTLRLDTSKNGEPRTGHRGALDSAQDRERLPAVRDRECPVSRMATDRGTRPSGSRARFRAHRPLAPEKRVV